MLRAVSHHLAPPSAKATAAPPQTVATAAAEKLLLRPEVLAQFDREKFESDGYWAWRGVLTEDGTRRWTAALQGVQSAQDSIIRDSSWRDVHERGGHPLPPPGRLATSFREGICGGSELLSYYPESVDAQGVNQSRGFLGIGIRQQMHSCGVEGLAGAQYSAHHGGGQASMMPEYFPCAFSNFLTQVVTDHPQMAELRDKLFDGARHVLDHTLLLNRKGEEGGGGGRGWHAHKYGDGSYEEDGLEAEEGLDEFGRPLAMGTGKARSKDFLQRQCIRCLCYPQGARAAEGGHLGMVPGAHLWRIPVGWASNIPHDAFAGAGGWLDGKTHPRTGVPLACEMLELPPGSILSL